ncbi:hypothetical protein F5X96DRAFT_131374 [Biscogniauxia mediterranea]|nr:hypothetical protein F5X96DRAFT_131374 [Biscogniauxia mediterranea]
MGIQGLLPLLKSIQRPTELKKYNGHIFGVDAYGWLHRGAVSCAIELAQGKPTRRYVDFAMNRVRMAKHFGVTPYLVFDGDFLPSKGITEESRSKRREASRKTGLELLKAGKPSQAHAELQKAIDVTPEMARHLIEELKKADIPYVVAPYEADAQLVYLERHGHISGILSEDSDLLVFGAKRLLTKLDQHGQCVEINRRDFCACREVSLTGWTDAQFRHMAILSGCDYLDSIGGFGLKTAHRMLRKHKTPEKVVRMLQFDGKYRVPTDYLKLFIQAEQTFLYQWAFCPKANELVHLTPPPADLNVEELPFIGSFVEPEMARRIAVGDVNPITKQEIVITSLPSPRKRTASAASRTMPPPPPRIAREPPGKPIDSYFKGHHRIPLGEMEPNCFSVDPDRLSGMTENGNRPIVFPLPRPYLDGDGPASSAASRTYINRAGSSSQALRRRTEPITNLLSNGGHSLSSSRRQSTGPNFTPSAASDNSTGTNGVRPPKKARLCDDAALEAGASKEKSKFFPSKEGKPRADDKGEGYLMSDDSIEEALKDLPDVDGWDSGSKGKTGVTVYQGESSQSYSTETTKDDGESSLLDSSSSDVATSQTDIVIPDTPPKNRLSHFSYEPGQSSLSKPRRTGSISRRQSGASSARNSLIELTPASVGTSTPMSLFSERSTSEATPATPQMTPLERIGAQALTRQKQPSTPTFKAPRPPKRSSLGRMSIDSLPINPAFEQGALYEPVGSEDLLVPDSEDEEGCPKSEKVGRQSEKTKSKKLDLSRFLFA